MGLNRTYGVYRFEDFLKKIEKVLEAEDDRWAWSIDRKQDIRNLDLDSIERFIAWRNHHYNKNRKPQTMLIRIENKTAAVFSNDIGALKTLQGIDPGNPNSVSFSEVDLSIPLGTMVFTKNPAHKYRVYFKSAVAPESFRDNLADFISRYKGTPTEVYPCGALERWLDKKSGSWRSKYCFNGYFLDYDIESTFTLISLMFDGMISRRFILEKRKP